MHCDLENYGGVAISIEFIDLKHSSNTYVDVLCVEDFLIKNESERVKCVLRDKKTKTMVGSNSLVLKFDFDKSFIENLLDGVSKLANK